MEYVFVTLGSLGAWLLFAGPIYQASLELGEQADLRARFESVAEAVPRPHRVNAWWWLFPPAAYVIHSRRQKHYQAEVMAQFTGEQRAEVVGFMNKAAGWFLVGAGAFCIALKETWELTELLDLSLWVFAGVAVLAAIACVLHTVLRIRVTQRVVENTTP